MLVLAMPAFGLEGGNVAQYTPSPTVMAANSGNGGAARKIFGGRTGYIHPFLSVGEYFTDNLFNSRTPNSDTYTVITPGIWLALPASRQQLIQVNTLDAAPGGLEVGRFHIESVRRFQGYALYRANIERHNRFSEEDNVYQRGEGLVNFNFRGGLSIEMSDIYERDHDPYGTGTSIKLDKFRSNYFNTVVTYRMSPKTTFRVDYANYSLKFSADRNQFRNRTDNFASGHVYYRIFPKTVFLIEYDFIDINYQTDDLSDSTEHHFWAGIQWHITARTKGQIKLGDSLKKFAKTGGDTNSFLAEMRLDYRISPKTSLYLIGVHKPLETDIQGMKDISSYRVRFGYVQRLTPKVGGTVKFYYVRDHYNGELTVGTQTDARTDNYYGAGIAIGYALQSWLNVGLDYEYVQRDSNFHTYNYKTNKVYLSLTAAL